MILTHLRKRRKFVVVICPWNVKEQYGGRMKTKRRSRFNDSNLGNTGGEHIELCLETEHLYLKNCEM